MGVLTRRIGSQVSISNRFDAVEIFTAWVDRHYNIKMMYLRTNHPIILQSVAKRYGVSFGMIKSGVRSSPD
jgi:hypothetical protein